MGGLGSGNTDIRLGAKPLAEHCPRLDVRRLHRAGLLVTGEVFPWSGKGSSGWVQVGAFDLVLEYPGNAGETFPLEWTPCHFGGRRPWLLCPGTVAAPCYARVAVLYLLRGRFRCRRCHGLAYRSQRKDRAHRLIDKAQKIRVRLGGSANLTIPFPSRPKRMHGRTYARLFLAATDATTEGMGMIGAGLEATFVRLAESVSRRFDRL